MCVKYYGYSKVDLVHESVSQQMKVILNINTKFFK